jgi:hypothetical protein
MSITNLKSVGGNLIDADWEVDDSSEREDLHFIAENMGYKVINIYNEMGHLALDDCCHGTLFLEPIEQKKLTL